jgi:hypothetical protein
MGKKSKLSKVVKSVKINNAVTKSQVSNDIDQLFSIAKEKKATQKLEVEETRMEAKNKPIKNEINNNDRNNDSIPYGMIKSNNKNMKICNPEAPLERIDKESGLPVYKAHLLKVGEGGGTPDCPFDCDCCF